MNLLLMLMLLLLLLLFSLAMLLVLMLELQAIDRRRGGSSGSSGCHMLVRTSSAWLLCWRTQLR
jgi:hypothetical protein